MGNVLDGTARFQAAFWQAIRSGRDVKPPTTNDLTELRSVAPETAKRPSDGNPAPV